MRPVLNKALAWIVGLLVKASVTFETKKDEARNMLQLRIIVQSRAGSFPTDWFDLPMAQVRTDAIDITTTN
jgi:hypothetical protein